MPTINSIIDPWRGLPGLLGDAVQTGYNRLLELGPEARNAGNWPQPPGLSDAIQHSRGLLTGPINVPKLTSEQKDTLAGQGLDMANPAGSLLPFFHILPGLLGMVKGVRREPNLMARRRAGMGDPVSLTHYSDKQLNSLDPKMMGSRPGSMISNNETSRATGGLPRIYAYTGQASNTPEHMLGKVRHDFTTTGLYDVAADPDGLMKIGRENALKQFKDDGMYGRPSASFIKNAQEKAIADAGYLGTVNQKVGQAQLFDAVDLVDMGDAKSLPNPERAKLANEIERMEQWNRLDASSQGAGIKRNKKTGRYVGAGPTVTSPQKKTAITNKYMGRIDDSLQAGIAPGYFYGEGRKALARITDSPLEHKAAADLMGPTSTQVGPYSNVNYMIRAMDQNAMGVPSNVTLYPNSLRRRVDSVMQGEDPWKGYKVDRYSNRLGPEGYSNHYMDLLPPNDQWEGFGTGLGKGKVPAGPAQVAFSDRIRADALERINRDRLEQGLRPLTAEEAQELHWAAIRAQTEGRPLQLNPGDTIQGSLPSFQFQHSWEAEPGLLTGMTRNIPKQPYADEIAGQLIDESGKDKLIRSMGGRLQDPVIPGTGVFEGRTSPGYQSRSFVSMTNEKGLDPASRARVDATESVRQYMLGQDARAGHVFRETDAPSMTNTVDLNLGATPSEETTRAIDMAVNKATGGKAGTVFSEDGARILNVGIDNKEFREAMQGIDFNALTGQSVTPKYGYREDLYDKYDWKGGNATRDMLNALDESGMPGPLRQADSAGTREIAGNIADVYKRMEKRGELSGSHKLSTALDAWKTQGLDGLRALVAKGLAPAALLALFSASQHIPQYGEQEIQ